MEKKVVLITGASKGIGKMTAIIFAKHNYDIIINYNDSKNEAEELSRELRNIYQVNTMVIKADVSNEQEVCQMIDEVIGHFSHIDVLVNNAGIAIDTTLEEKTVSNFERILAVNLIGPFLTSKHIGNHMLKQKQGCIINVSSTNGINTNYVESMDYDASKAALISLTKNFAKAYAPYIRVNAIAPGWVNTPMNKELDQEFINNEYQKILLNRFAEPNEIAEVIYFLATEKASYINGTTISIDGGSQ